MFIHRVSSFCRLYRRNTASSETPCRGGDGNLQKQTTSSFARNAVGNTTPVWAPILNLTNPGAICSGKDSFNIDFLYTSRKLSFPQMEEYLTDRTNIGDAMATIVTSCNVWRHVASSTTSRHFKTWDHVNKLSLLQLRLSSWGHGQLLKTRHYRMKLRNNKFHAALFKSAAWNSFVHN